MSHLRLTPAKLLLLVSIGLLTCMAVQERRSLRPSARKTMPTAPAESDGLRYPAHLVRQQKPVVLAGFSFDAPPLPSPSTKQPNKSAPTPVVQQSSNSPSAAAADQKTVNHRNKLSRSILRRPPPVKKDEVNPQPIGPDVRQSAEAEPKAAGIRRLPPVAKFDEPPSLNVPRSDSTDRSVPLHPTTEVTIAPIPKQAAIGTSPESAQLPFHSQQQDIEDELVSEKNPVVRFAAKPAQTVGTGVLPDQSDKITDKITGKTSDKTDNSNDESASPVPVTPRPSQTAELRAKPDASTKQARQPTPALVAANRIPGPNPARAAVSRRAMELVRRGQSLAVRNAQYSARADFVQALRLIAQAQDAMHGGSLHSKNLAAGLLALREAQDFVPSGRGRWTDQFDVRVISAAHGTPVLRERESGEGPPTDLTPWQARQMYYTFAQEKLTEAGGRNTVASAALSSLGKLYVGRDGTAGDENLVSSAQAMSFFQAALRVDSRNYMAANELGVLLARYGQLQDSRKVLQHGVAVEKDFPPLWRNLAVVHQRLGEIDLERRARNEFNLARQRIESGQGQSDAGNSIRWVDAETFAGLTPRPARPRTAEQPPAAERANDAEKPSWRFW